ncbi:MAG: RluA family pseudouridine synthase [Bacteroidetes bacterium]|nr:RluA family pseudouridine synthase [Bacteroidota bacterium]
METSELKKDLFEHYSFTADKNQSLLRIDKFLMDKIQNATRTKIQSAINNNYIKVNDKDIKANYKIKPNDIIKILLPTEPKESEVIPEKIELDIVYEDESIIIINKPSGMVVHPAYNNWTGTLVNGLAYYFENLPNKKGNIGRPGLVHRIDKDTSGLLVIAKTEESMNSLSKQFFDHSIDRKYYALVWGDFDEDDGTIDKMLKRSFNDRRVVDVTQDDNFGKKAITHFKVIERFRYVTLIECSLETGRTHQIRAHMKHIGHSIFGDKTYGGDRILKGPIFSKYKAFINNCFSIMPSQALHAKSIGFIHPQTKKYVKFESDLPTEFESILEKWRNYIIPNNSFF